MVERTPTNHALSGCMERPCILTFQSWMIFTIFHFWDEFVKRGKSVAFRKDDEQQFINLPGRGRS